jgi:hypothetical protein
MSKPSVIKIADHAERQSRLRLDEREGRPLDPSEIEREYDRVCLVVFGHTADRPTEAAGLRLVSYFTRAVPVLRGRPLGRTGLPDLTSSKPAGKYFFAIASASAPGSEPNRHRIELAGEL